MSDMDDRDLFGDEDDGAHEGYSEHPSYCQCPYCEEDE